MKKIIPVLFCLLVLSACDTTKRDRLSADTLRISTDPTTIPVTMVFSSTMTLKAICSSPKSSDVDVSPTWSVENKLGVFTPAQGKSTVFTAGTTAGTGKIFATVGSVRSAGLTLSVGASTSPVVPVSTIYYIYSDQINGFNTDLATVGPNFDVAQIFTGGSGIHLMGLQKDTINKSEGTQSLVSTYTVTAGDDYVGWFATFTTPKDMSVFSAGHLKVDVMSSVDLQVGIRSNNINANSNTAKVFLSAYGSVNGSGFTTISIPIAALVAAHPGTDLTQVKDAFIVAVIGSHVGVPKNDQSFWIDNVRWEK